MVDGLNFYVVLYFRSTVLSQNRSKVLSNAEKHDPTFMSSDLNTGVHTNSCGHVMHADCWQR